MRIAVIVAFLAASMSWSVPASAQGGPGPYWPSPASGRGGYDRPVAMPGQPREIVGRASVVDGDTIEIHGVRIRLFGIDAPENDARNGISQPCENAQGREYPSGRVAAMALDQRVTGKVVSCEQRDVDRYERVVAVCRAGGEDLNGWLVSEGLARAYVKYGNDYAAAEARAREQRRGIWAGRFQDPSDYRAQKRRY